MTVRRIVSALTSAALAATVFYAVTGAQVPTRSVSEGVYTAEQAMRGDALYKEQCASCHGDMLEGSGPMPPLVGPDFAKNWEGKTVWELFEKTHTSMPATAPGTLTEQQTADVLAYMLSVAKYPAGATELAGTMEPLNQIKLEAPPPPPPQ